MYEVPIYERADIPKLRTNQKLIRLYVREKETHDDRIAINKFRKIAELLSADHGVSRRLVFAIFRLSENSAKIYGSLLPAIQNGAIWEGLAGIEQFGRIQKIRTRISGVK